MTAPHTMPRLVIAGLSGGCGKTVVSLGLLLAAQEDGMPVAAFKKGPDYIDAAWLSWASGRPARNLDTYLMGFERAAESFTRNAQPAGLNIIEGNRGLFDGLDARGTHSTAELAKALRAPVVLVLNATKVTRTAAAVVLGCQKLDPGVEIAGVILNQVSGHRHEGVLREAIEADCGIPILGVIPRAEVGDLLPERHLGLTAPQEYPELERVRTRLANVVGSRMEIEKLREVSHLAPALVPGERPSSALPAGSGLKVGYIHDSAFTFYYPENLEALENAGAELIPVSALLAASLPEDLDALYIGGGFPETHGERLSANAAFLASLRNAAGQGLPIYAECGGLMLLARSILWRGLQHPMAGALPLDVEVCARPQGHGYIELVVDTPNAFFPLGSVLRGHEFHYSRILPAAGLPPTACAVRRGAGCYEGRDGMLGRNLWASYTHLHVLATPEWARGLLQAARRFSLTAAPSLR